MNKRANDILYETGFLFVKSVLIFICFNKWCFLVQELKSILNFFQGLNIKLFKTSFTLITSIRYILINYYQANHRKTEY